eukprot:TRINITY_DN8222_c0_g1_i1.p1 TRINITY_DN8222_c0_g1~~TRINITY_DN8222_c0_g1_i1.p1  ORF type:complete len:240 (+),score=45.73 TRINITY_DN8222_c0_g1_i1:42-722(+)
MNAPPNVDRIPDPPTLVLPREKLDDSISQSVLPLSQDDRLRTYNSILNRNFCFIATALGATAGGILGAFEGYKLGKEASLYVLSQKQENFNAATAKQIPKSEALWFVGSTALRETFKGALMKSFRFGSVVGTLSYTEYWMSTVMPSSVPTIVNSVVAGCAAGSVMSLLVKGVRNVPNGFASGGLVLGIPYGLFLMLFRKSNEFLLKEYVRLEEEQQMTPTPTSETS